MKSFTFFIFQFFQTYELNRIISFGISCVNKIALKRIRCLQPKVKQKRFIVGQKISEEKYFFLFEIM